MLAFSVVVPTTNSAGHIDIVLDFYAAALATARPLCGSDFDETAGRLAARFPDAMRLPDPPTADDA